MALNDDLQSEVQDIFATRWETRDGQKVPEAEDVKLGKDAVKLHAVILYADLAESTNLVDNNKATFAAEIYKSYLHCASKIIRSEGGVITAFDGDRIMAVFLGEAKNTSAARSALKINHAVVKTINPAIKNQYASSTYVLKQSVGIDRSDLFVARTGIRGSNDLVWVGRSANYAAKLCSRRVYPYASYITKDVYDNLAAELKVTDGQAMWEQEWWAEKQIWTYRSSWIWRP